MKPSSGSGGVRPKGGINGNGSVEVGINLKLAEIGISTDYGGAGIVGFGGQRIVWGPEGGQININLGIFEVDVVARDCVVTETKKIAGQIVATRTYPDPGCKLPEPPTPTPTPTPAPTPEQGIELPDTDEIGWVAFQDARWQRTLDNKYIRASYSPTIEDTAEVPAKRDPSPFSIYRNFGETIHRVPKGAAARYTSTILWSDSELTKPYGRGQLYGAVQEMRSFQSSTTINGVRYWSSTLVSGAEYGINLAYFGKAKDIKKVIDQLAKRDAFRLTYVQSAPNFGNDSGSRHIPVAWIPLNPTTQKPQPSAGNRPPMPDSCCEALKADIEDIKQVLATKEMLAGKLTFPWRLRMPGGSGNEVITDYPNLIRALAQQIDHLGIHPPHLYVQDNNNAIAGNQEVDEQFPSATRALEALLAKTWNTHSDLATITNFLYRMAFLNVNQSTSIAKLQADTLAIKNMLGGEREPDIASISTPFNVAAGVNSVASTRGKGFGKNGKNGKPNPKIDLNTEATTEELIPELLKMRDNQILIERFTGNKDIFDMLSLIILKLESLQYR